MSQKKHRKKMSQAALEKQHEKMASQIVVIEDEVPQDPSGVVRELSAQELEDYKEMCIAQGIPLPDFMRHK